MDYDPTLASSSLRFTEKLCAAAFPIGAAIGALVFAVFGCFECQKARRGNKSSYCYNDLARLSRESHFTVSEVVALFEKLFIESRESQFTVNEVEALYELFKKLSNSIFDDGFIHKEEFQLALFRTEYRQNIFCDRRLADASDWADYFFLSFCANRFLIFLIKKRQGVIDLEEFVQALNVFHPNAPTEDKVEFAFKLYDLRQTGFIEREVVKQVVIAILSESDMKLSDELLDQIIEKTFVDADADEDGKISEEDWKAFVKQHPSLLKNMTLPSLKVL